MTQICNCCDQEKHDAQFPIGGNYVNKRGEMRQYRRKTCKECYAGHYRNNGREQKRDRFNRMVGWPAVLLTIVIGIYQFDSVSGRNRTCTYVSVYGHHSVTIDAMNMCPLTWEFEV